MIRARGCGARAINRDSVSASTFVERLLRVSRILAHDGEHGAIEVPSGRPWAPLLLLCNPGSCLHCIEHGRYREPSAESELIAAVIARSHRSLSSDDGGNHADACRAAHVKAVVIRVLRTTP